jgi:hypothetical protein
MNKNKKNVNVPYIPFDSCYVLTKGEKGVHAKFVGTPIVGLKKKAIWVPKSLVTNLQHYKTTTPLATHICVAKSPYMRW